jgi:hypothetical protein
LSQIADLGLITVSEAPAIMANLRWQPGSCITFTGVLLSDVPALIKVCQTTCLQLISLLNVCFTVPPSGFKTCSVDIGSFMEH